MGEPWVCWAGRRMEGVVVSLKSVWRLPQWYDVSCFWSGRGRGNYSAVESSKGWRSEMNESRFPANFFSAPAFHPFAPLSSYKPTAFPTSFSALHICFTDTL